MRIYLVRHAEAVDRTAAIPEPLRHLTAAGRVSFRETAARAREDGVRLSRIFTSPLVRAVQTAEILAEGLRFEGEVVVAPQLAPGFDVEGLNALLGDFPDALDAAFVGHEPDLGRVVAQLLSFPKAFPLRKGAVAALDLADPAGGRLPATFAWLREGNRRVEETGEVGG
jgi:phosphohistidine phosphatase